MCRAADGGSVELTEVHIDPSNGPEEAGKASTGTQNGHRASGDSAWEELAEGGGKPGEARPAPVRVTSPFASKARVCNCARNIARFSGKPPGSCRSICCVYVQVS